MAFKIILSNTKDSIQIETIDEVRAIMERISVGDNIIITDGGIFNPSYLVAIMYDEKKSADEAYLKNIGFKKGGNSPFAKLLNKTKELNA